MTYAEIKEVCFDSLAVVSCFFVKSKRSFCCLFWLSFCCSPFIEHGDS